MIVIAAIVSIIGNIRTDVKTLIGAVIYVFSGEHKLFYQMASTLFYHARIQHTARNISMSLIRLGKLSQKQNL